MECTLSLVMILLALMLATTTLATTTLKVSVIAGISEEKGMPVLGRC